MKQIVVIYLILTSYTRSILRDMADRGRAQLDVIYEPLSSGDGFGEYLLFGGSKLDSS